jgi:hypothetical protein
MADSLQALAKRDSIARIAARQDSTPALRARTDSIARVKRADSVSAAERTERAAREAQRLAAARSGRRLAPVDTTPPPKIRRPALFTEVYLTFDSVLPPQTQFRVVVESVRRLSGTVRSPSRTFSTPKVPKVDSTAVRRDSTAAKPVVPAARRDTLGRR